MSILLTGGKTALTPKMATAASPAWIDIGTENWTVGDVFIAGTFSLSTYIIDTSPAGFTSYVLDSGSLPSGLSVEASTGDILGTIAAIQGGTYHPVFKATNLQGSTVKATLTIVLVGLAAVAPVLVNPDALPNLEEGSIVSFYIGTGITNTQGSPVTYSLNSGTLPDDITVATNGHVSGTIASGQDTGSPYNPEYKVIDTVTGLSDTSTHTMTVTSGVAVAPTITAADSGIPGCTATKPAWINDIPNFALDVGEGLSLDLKDYVHDCGDALTAFASSGTAIPTGLSLVTTGATMGTFTGTVSSAALFTPTFTAANSTGTSVDSNTPDMDVSADAPVLLSVRGSDGSTDVVATFSEEMTSDPAASYTDGFEFLVNGVAKGLTYKSGAITTKQITYTSAVTIDGANTLSLQYTDVPNGDMQGVTSGLTLADAAVTYAVPVPSAGFTIEQDYEDIALGNEHPEFTTTQSVASNDFVYSGFNTSFPTITKSLKHHIIEGEFGFGKWGGIIDFPDRLTGGDEFWVRVPLYFPIGFNYDVVNLNRLKFFRAKTWKYDDSSTGAGHNDIYIMSSNSNKAFYSWHELAGVPAEEFGDSGDKPTLGTWEVYEWYVKLDSTSEDNGGVAKVRFWKDGELLHDPTNRETLFRSNDFVEAFNLFTYWNNGSPATQDCYSGPITITTVTPAAIDANGNHFIGMD